jgi:long-subunit fatty acid transport protein
MVRRHGGPLRTILSAIALLSASPAMAGGFFYSDSGIVGAGRGGAIIASTSDQFAQYHNPAGLIRVKHPTFSIGGSAVQQRVEFDRLRPDGTSFPTAQNQATPFLVPQFGFVLPVHEKVVTAIGFTSPFAPSSEYDANGPQRYAIINTSIKQFSITPSVAVQPIKQLTLGLGFQWKALILEEELKVSTSDDESLLALAPGFENITDPLSPDNDVLVNITAKDIFQPSFIAGLLIEPIEPLSIGFAVQPPTSFQARGAGAIDFSGNLIEPLVDPPDPDACDEPSDVESCPRLFTDDDVGVDITLPLVVRTGIAVRPIPILEIETAFVYQRWGSIGDIIVTDIDLTLQTALGEQPVDDTIPLPSSMMDTYSFRLGGELDLLDNVLSVRAGGFYETGSQKDEKLSVTLLDPAKYQIGTGTTLRLLDQRLILDSAFAYIGFPTKEIRSSTSVLINVLDETNTGVVANGDYRSFGWIVGGQASWVFKPSKKKQVDG